MKLQFQVEIVFLSAYHNHNPTTGCYYNSSHILSFRMMKFESHRTTKFIFTLRSKVASKQG